MKLGVREICDVVFKAKSKMTIGNHTFNPGEPVIYFDSLKTSSLEQASTTVYATGGKGNTRLLAWEGEKTLTFTMEDALISPKSLAILSGAGLINADTGSTVVAHATQTVIVGTDGKIKVDGAVAADGDIYVMLLDGNGEMSGRPVKGAKGAETTTDDKITATEITVPTRVAAEGEDPATLFVAGDVVLVDFYKEYTTDAVEVDITADKFAGYFYVEASTLFKRELDGVDLPAEFIIPKAKVQSNFTFTMASSGDPSTFTFTLDAFPDFTKFDKAKKVLAKIQVLEADDNFDLSTSSATELDYQRYEYNTDAAGKYISEKKHTSDDTAKTKTAE